MNSAHPLSNPNGFSDLFGIYLHPRHPVLARRTPTGRWSGTSARATCCSPSWSSIWVVVVGLDDDVRAQRQPEARRAEGRTRRRHVDANRAATSRARRCASARPSSALWAASTTGTSNGSVNSMHDSYTPLGGMMPLIHMKLGEVSPGGVGVGLNGMLVLALLAVFIAGLMVGRTPEYLGQEDPGQRGQARRALHPRDAGRGARRSRDRDRHAERAERLDLEPGPARLHRGALRVHLGREQQRLGVRRDHREHAVHEHRARASRCSSAGSS